MKLMVLDGNSIVNRAFYGVRLLSTRNGLYTNALFGFLNILQKLINDEQPDALCVAFDRKAPTFRHLAYAGYKAKRHAMPEELAMQMPVLKEILAAMHIPTYELDGWEADDLLGTISRTCEQKGWDCVIVTGDRDSLQLVTDHTTVNLVTTSRGQTTVKQVTPTVFEEKYGFEPVKLIDLKGLWGDASDQIPGVKGIGEKTATSLIQQYGTIAEIYAKLDDLDLKPAVRKKLTEGREQAELSYDLARIRCDAPIVFQPEDVLRQEPDRDALYQLFLKLEFNQFIQRYGLSPAENGGEPEELTEGACQMELVTDPTRLEQLLTLWQNAPWVSVLTLPDLQGVAVDGVEEDEGSIGAVILPDRVGADAYRHCLEVLFSDKVTKVTHQVKELAEDLLAEGLPIEGFRFDTALGAYLLAPTDGSYAMEKLSVKWLGFELPPAQTFLAEDAFPPLEEPTEAMTAMLRHTAAIGALYEKMRPELEAQGLTELLNTVELPLCPVLAEMEQSGFRIDREALTQFGEMLAKGIDGCRDSIYDLAGEEFNINSTKQLGEILFDKLGLPAYKKTKRGYSTNAEVLEKLRWQHPIVEQILEYRQLAKLKSTYVDGLTKVIGSDSRIHTSFQNTVTATGRLSSTEPNLQNIPVRTPLGAEMRKMFIAGPGNVLVDADYSQIELRLLAHIAQDQVMLEGFRMGADIHTMTAAQVFGVPEELVTKQMRSSAKAVNFGIIYGISEFSLAKDIGVSRAEAKDYMERYFATYAGVREYQKRIVEQAKADGYVTTLMGRRRDIPELKDSNRMKRMFGERVALNMPIQGTAADIIKLAMIRVQARLKADGLQGRLVLQVHDELIVECPEAEGETVAKLLKEEMEQVVSLDVKLEAEAHVGHSWADAH